MAKKVQTPEEYKEKLDKKVEKRKRFTKVFLTALAYTLAIAIVFSVTVIANKPVTSSVAASGSNTESEEGTTVKKIDADAEIETSAVDTSTELSNSSSAADVVAYFNSALNLVKPNAKKITLLKEVNSQAGPLEGSLPSFVTSIADKLIADNMGEKDLSTLDPGLVNATTVEQKNAMFPVENHAWSSQLEADDIEKFDVADDGSYYTITLYIKEDKPSEGTDYGVGHAGRIFSVIKPSIVTDNAGVAASLISAVKTGHKDGYVKAKIEKSTGNVVEATYYFTWTLAVTVDAKLTTIDVSIPFGLEKQFKIEW